MPIKIASIYNLDDINASQLRQIAEEFKVCNIENKGFTALRIEVEASTAFKSKFGENELDESYLFCFGRTGNYICTLPEVDYNHHFIIPEQFRISSIKTAVQKKQVLLQVAKYDHNGTVTLRWDELLLPQILDIAKEFDVVVKLGPLMDVSTY